MMTFKQYLAEGEEDGGKKIVALLQKDCAPFMKECVRGGFLYRGINSLNHGDAVLTVEHNGDEIPVYKKSVRQDRRPLNTSEEGQAMYDKWFEKKFGYKVRAESMFCFPEDMKQNIDQYGSECLVFPIGDFQYVWSPKVADLQMYAGERLGYASEIEVMLMLNKAGYKSTGLVSALGSRSEIMVRCKSYYAIPVEFTFDIHDLVM